MDGQELQQKRKEAGVTQLELAKYLGYTINGEPNRSMIARFENGHAKINPRIAMLIESFFNKKWWKHLYI